MCYKSAYVIYEWYLNAHAQLVVGELHGLHVALHSWIQLEMKEIEWVKNSWNQLRSMGPALVSRIFFRCLIFNCYNISICKKGKLKDETSKKIHETCCRGATWAPRCLAFMNPAWNERNRMSQKFDKNIIKIYIFRKIHTIVVYKTQHFSFRFLVLWLSNG